MSHRTAHLVLICLLSVSGCSGGGGGGGGGASPQTSNDLTVSGTVAVGAPLADVIVQVIDKNGLSGTTRTDAAGHYSVTIPRATPPYIIEAYDYVQNANPTYQRLYSIATKSGTANVTPLTSLVVSRLFGRGQEYFPDLTSWTSLAPPTSEQLVTAQRDVAAYLLTHPSKYDGNLVSPIDVSGVSDFFFTPFRPQAGDVYDDALERLGQSLMDGETIQALEERMFSADDPAANLMSLFPLAFEANCTGSEGSPSGQLQVSLAENGQIRVGSFSYTLQAGDLVWLSTGRTGSADRWTFSLNAPPVYIEFVESAGRLLSMQVGSSICTPISQVSMNSRHPSRLAQVRLLKEVVSKATGARIYCPLSASSVAGIQDGLNFLFFDANGAMHVSSYLDGLALHLPSMGFSLLGQFVATADGLKPVLRSLLAERTIKSDLDSFLIRTADDGTITEATFGRRRGDQGWVSACSQAA